jgi:hypothetical protein
MAEGRKLIKDEADDSLTEKFVHNVDDFPQTGETDEHE